MTADASLRELAAKATPGPWSMVNSPHEDVVIASDLPPDDDDRVVAFTYTSRSDADSRYLAAVSPDVVLALLDRAEAAEAAAARVRAVLSQYSSYRLADRILAALGGGA